MNLSIDVVITAYGRYDLTRNCLNHLSAQTRGHHVVLVDNGSDDDTSRMTARDFPHVQLLRLPENRPFAEATNHGVAQCDGDVIVLLNNDVDARPSFLEELVAPMEADSGVGSVSALLLRPGEELIDSAGLTADPTLACFPRHQGRPLSGSTDSRPSLLGPAGAGAAYRRVAWQRVGGLDDTMFAYMEDFELALRLRVAGWKAAMALDAVAVHIGSATHGHRSARQRRHGGFGRGYVLRRYGVLRRRGPRAFVTELIVIVGDLVISRDLEAAKGRIEGWRAGSGAIRLPFPPRDAIDSTIGFRESIARRRGVYGQQAAK